MNREKISVIPAGFSYTFLTYRTEMIPLDELYAVLCRPELQAELERLKPGLFKIERYAQGAIICNIAYPVKNEVEILKNGMVTKLSIPQLETAKLLFLPGYLLLSGKQNAGKMALQMLTPFLNISGTFVRPSQEKLTMLTDQAVVIKSCSFTNISHSEIEKLTISGEIEDLFACGPLPLRESEISSFTGVYNTPHGIRSFKFSRSGKVQIYKSKRSPIFLDLLDYAVGMVSE